MPGFTLIDLLANHLRQDKQKGLTVRPEPFDGAQESLVEGWTVKPFMVRQAHHERLNLNLSRLKWVADLFILIKILRHTGRDCRYLGHMEVSIACHPWLLDSLRALTGPAIPAGKTVGVKC